MVEQMKFKLSIYMAFIYCCLTSNAVMAVTTSKNAVATSKSKTNCKFKITEQQALRFAQREFVRLDRTGFIDFKVIKDWEICSWFIFADRHMNSLYESEGMILDANGKVSMHVPPM